MSIWLINSVVVEVQSPPAKKKIEERNSLELWQCGHSGAKYKALFGKVAIEES